MRGMDSYPKAAMERAMKIQEVILRAMAKKITWWQAAETTLSQAGTLRPGGESAGPVSGEIFRSERAAFSREVTRAACHRSELHVGEDGVARGWIGGTAAAAGCASQAPGAAALAGHAAAHRWEPSSVVPGRALV